MDERAHSSVKNRRRISEARQEGSTNGECSTHTLPQPSVLKMQFYFPHIPVTRVLLYASLAREAVRPGVNE